MNAARVLGDRQLGVARLRLGQHDRLAFGSDQHVDLAHVNRVRELGREAQRARQARVRLDDQHAVRIAPAAQQLVDRGARVQRERAAAVAVGRRGRGGHHARRHPPRDPREAAEVGGDEPDGVARVAQSAFDRPVEARVQRDTGACEERKQVDEQRGEHVEPLEALARAERVEQLDGLAGSERHGERIRVAHEACCLIGPELLHRWQGS